MANGTTKEGRGVAADPIQFTLMKPMRRAGKSEAGGADGGTTDGMRGTRELPPPLCRGIADDLHSAPTLSLRYYGYYAPLGRRPTRERQTGQYALGKASLSSSVSYPFIVFWQYPHAANIATLAYASAAMANLAEHAAVTSASYPPSSLSPIVHGAGPGLPLQGCLFAAMTFRSDNGCGWRRPTDQRAKKSKLNER
ncbi:uncharacterized protein K460DRAFT_397357 [Cucurbitaria berberidis CBS 394.84]|uniref:Uncharacterized protein n=1 Tax=Cucurbitaria berberidis CBS 394.84 TaxID=1168544 RepID=A0A9P4L7E1_9PLEO|nr:uncharacterized protein K460DRAFT_397357 [Cucurbitaria berberidis CBS 394.84]KAF1844219.1 hypothetical protein K460DRAFT_397357 [Cucurbitaria berberidis CBS 394.84]